MWLAQPRTISPHLLFRYGESFDNLTWTQIQNGFSSAEVYRGEDRSGTPRFALKRWPEQTSPARLDRIHAWMRQAARLPFVPKILATIDGCSFVADGSRVWDATHWLPGEPAQQAGKLEVERACEAVAELHDSWLPSPQRLPCPGVHRRIKVLEEWLAHPAASLDAEYPSLSSDLIIARELLHRLVPPALAALKSWLEVPLSIQPCVRDLRGDHVLFSGERVSGIVDYGAMDFDSPASDLARLLGDLAGDNDELFSGGLAKYRGRLPRFDVGDELVRLLDRTGTVCSVAGWIWRLRTKQVQIPLEAIQNRLSRLLVRAATCKSF